MSTSVASAFAREVLRRPHLQHGAVRLGLWIAGVAELQGGFPVAAHVVDFIKGIHNDAVDVEGVSFRNETVTKSIESLQSEGLLSVTHDPRLGSGKRAPRLYTLTVE